MNKWERLSSNLIFSSRTIFLNYYKLFFLSLLLKANSYDVDIWLFSNYYYQDLNLHAKTTGDLDQQLADCFA